MVGMVGVVETEESVGSGVVVSSFRAQRMDPAAGSEGSAGGAEMVGKGADLGSVAAAVARSAEEPVAL